jgi:hypothetical protein
MAMRKNQLFGQKFWRLALFVCLASCSMSGGADLRAKYDVCFIQDYPGATGRVVAYTPVRCSDKKVVLGEPIDGEFASLEFEDTDADGVSEIVVASSEFRCRWSGEGCAGPTRTIVKVSGERNAPVFTVVSVEKLEPSAEFK